MYTVVSEHVLSWLRTFGGNGTTYSKHMEGARFTIPTPALLAKVEDMIDKVPMEDRDTKGDLHEYMLGKIASAGQNGQFRTPRHIIRLMVEMVEPKPTDIVCDPACGTCGFLVAVGESLRERHPEGAAWSGEPGHHLSRLARSGPCRGRREVHAGTGQSAVCRVARL
jgi:type I restriction enzyme M protein